MDGHPYLRPAAPLAPPIPDRYDDFVADLVRPAAEVAPDEAGAALVGIPFDTTTLGRGGSRYGPAAVRAALATCLCYDPGFGVDLAGAPRVADWGDVDVVHTDVEETWRRVSEVVGSLSRAGLPLIVVGGDHGLTFPVLRGLAWREGRLGVVTVDAHFDVRISQRDQVSAGVPFRYVLEQLPELVAGRNLVEFGIGGWRNSRLYADFLREQGARVVPAREVNRGDLDALVQEALEVAGDGTAGIWLSLDIDGVDASQAPGTGTPATAGLTSFQLLELVWAFGRDPRAVGLDVMEVAPAWEHGTATAALAASCILTFLAGRESRLANGR
jgi:formimidoylglutamase